MQTLIGYKSFNKDYTNNYGKKFEEDKNYHVDGGIKYGLHGNGYHFSTNIEDTIRYCKDKDIKIGKIQASNIIIKGSTESDDYYGYYNNYVTSDIKILKFLEREEIINIMLKLPPYRIERFIRDYFLTESEQNIFYGISKEIDNAIDYYQKGIKDTYIKIRR